MNLSSENTITEKLRVLNLEDYANDSELIRAELETVWRIVELLRVETRTEFVRALDEFKPDVVLSDFKLPDINGREALSIVRQTHPDIPVIMVTGALGDIEAVDLVKLGAKDYVMKDHLHRLTPAVSNALSQEHGIRARKAAEKALQQSEADLRALVENSPVAMIVDIGIDAHEELVLMNQEFTKLFGYTLEDTPDVRHWWQLAYPDEQYREEVKADWIGRVEKAVQSSGNIIPMETRVTCKDGSIRHVRISLSSIGNRNIVTFEDLTESKKLEEALKEAADRNRVMMETANDAIICMDQHGLIYLWNRKAEEMFGYPAAEAIGQNLHQLIMPHHYRDQSTAGLLNFFRGGVGPAVGKTKQFTARRKDNSEFHIELSVSAMNIHGAWHATGIIRDITERIQAEAHIRKLNMLNTALSQCNQAIVRSKSEQELFHQICRGAVQFGGFKMAWIGLLDPASHWVTPVASSGTGAETYLRDIQISADAASEYGQGPTGVCIRDNQPYWCQDFLQSALTSPWHERAQALGWRSSASLPLRQEGRVIGAFMLYAAEPDAFDEEARNLLLEMAEDINYALDNLHHEAQRKQAEEELRKLSVAVEQNPSSIIITDLNADIEYVNEAFIQITGFKREDVIGKNPRVLHSGKNSRETYNDLWAHLSRGEIWQGELINRRKDGSEFVESALISPVRNSKGHMTHYLAVKMDITARKQAETKLSHDALRFEGLLKINEMGGLLPEQEFLRLGLEWVEKLTGSQIAFIHFVNEDQENIELVTWSTATTENYCKASFESHYPLKNAGIWADCLRQRKPVVFNDYANTADKRGLPEGHSALNRLISVPVIEENRVRVILGVGNKDSDYTDTDIEIAQLFGNDMWRIIRRQRLEAELAANLSSTIGLNQELKQANAELKATQNQLLQSEKMASIGQLAAGVAHEINNPVGYVNSNLGTLEKYLADIFVVLDKYEAAEVLNCGDNPLLDELRQFKDKINLAYLREDTKALISESHQGLERVKKIILDLKDFSHADAEENWIWANVQQGIESTLNVVWNELKYKCEVVKDFAPLPEIYCLPSQLNQVFMNLLVNAAQAIEVRGKITIRTGQQDDKIWIEVADTGKGIPPEIIPLIFNPFFTTKPVGKGTGLGLSVSYKIVEKHHGKIEVSSEVGKGSIFRVWLPIQHTGSKETP
jgi:PAS domain S-box-containing protein